MNGLTAIMSKLTSRLFTQSDRERITAAVQAAEGKTAGEIVPYVVERSDNYEDAAWRAALLFAFAALGALVLLRRFTSFWFPDFLTVAFVIVLFAGVGFMLVDFVPALTRLLAGKELLDLRVSQRAAEAFIAEEVFNTRDRTGILLFVSLLEHRVLVVGDSGINAKVKQAEWEDLVQRVVGAIRAGKPAEGLIAAIQQCGVLLQKREVERRADDRDELADSLRIGG
jgi:putative membrane protein